jgi:class 3 adenylate cyclase
VPPAVGENLRVEIPETRYARSSGVHIAYSVFGDGDVTLVYTPSFVSHVELIWEEPLAARFFERLGSFSPDAVRDLGLELRAGVHTGECEVVDGKVAGLAVSIGARVAAQAGPGEVLVSQTVKDLVAGSGIEFEDRGAAELKGVPGEWRLFAVESA